MDNLPKPARSKSSARKVGGLLTRKSVKKHQTLPVHHNILHSSTDTLTNTLAIHEDDEKSHENKSLDAHNSATVTAAPAIFSSSPPPAVSLVPDILHELPSWYNSQLEISASASAAHFRLTNPLHNPVGPRQYFNHHLAPLPGQM